MRNGFWAGVIPGAMIVLLLMQPHGYAANTWVKSKHRVTLATGKHAVRNKHDAQKKPASVQIISFPDTQWHAVKVIRGGTPAKDETAGVEPAEKAETAEIVTFPNPDSKPVRVVRGDTDHSPSMPPDAHGMSTQLVTFANRSHGSTRHRRPRRQRDRDRSRSPSGTARCPGEIARSCLGARLPAEPQGRRT